MGFNWMWGTDSIRDSVLGKKDDSDNFTEVANRFGSLEQPLTDFYSSQLGQPGKTFPGGAEAAVAPISGQEEKSLRYLEDFGQSGFGSTFDAGKSQIEKTLTNQFDPTTSPYYQAVKAESARNLEQTQKNISDQSAGGGRFYSGARVAEQGEAATESALNLNTIMATLADRERDRALSVLPQALQYEQAEYQQPLEKAAAFQSLGALPREIDQAGRTFDVDQWQQSEIDYPLQIAEMVQNLLNSNQPVLEEKQPSGLDRFLGSAGSAAGSASTMALLTALMGCWVAKEVFGGWEKQGTINARYYIQNVAPKWFKDFYMKHGEKFADYISDKPIIKIALLPLFSLFALVGEKERDNKGGMLNGFV